MRYLTAAIVITLAACSTQTPTQRLAADACDLLENGTSVERVAEWIVWHADKEGIRDHAVVIAMKDECPIVLVVIGMEN